MSNFYLSPNMSLVVPVPSVDIGPDWAQNLNASLGILDAHTHNPGSGVQITPSGLNINADLSFQGHNVTVLRSSRFQNQSAVLSTASDLSCAYSSGTNGDLYWNDQNGNKIQMTRNGSPNSGTGNISGLPSTPTGSAGIGWQNSASTFQFLADNGTSGANIDVATMVVRYPGSYPTPAGNYIAVQAPTSLASGYSLTLPALPGQTNVMTMTSTGVMSSITYDQVGVNMTSTGANAIGLSINSSSSANNIASQMSSPNFPGVPQAAGRDIVVAGSNAAGALKVIRGNIASDGSITNGDGFTITNVGTGEYRINFTSAFSLVPSCSGNTTGGSNIIVSFDQLSTSSVLVLTINNSSSIVASAFTFIVIGPV